MADVVPMDFANSLDREFSQSEALPPKKLGAIADWFMDKVRKVIQSSELANLSREEFIKAVGDAYDKYVLPIDLPGPDVLLDPLLKKLLESQAGKVWGKFMATGLVD
jgi:hypothetical protein